MRNPGLPAGPGRTLAQVIGLICVVLFAILTVSLSPDLARAATTSVTTGSDWQSGTLDGVEATSTEGELKLDPAGSWGAQSWKTPDKTIGIGSAFTSDGGKIYVFRGYGDVAFWRYTPTTAGCLAMIMSAIWSLRVLLAATMAPIRF